MARVEELEWLAARGLLRGERDAYARALKRIGNGCIAGITEKLQQIGEEKRALERAWKRRTHA